MKEVIVKIIGAQLSHGEEETQMEFMTEGKMYYRKGIIYITYDESQMAGMDGCKTRLKIDRSKVKMTRTGCVPEMDTEILFEQGERFSGVYGTPYGSVAMEVLTNRLENNVTEEGTGKIEIDYDISLKGLLEGRSKLNVEVNRKM